MKYSCDKDLNKCVAKYVSLGGWSVIQGGAHKIAISPAGRKLPIPGSPNRHSVVMWEKQAKKLLAAA